MNSFVLALRAIGAEFILRIYTPILIIGVAVFVLLFAGALWLTTLSQWWWLLLIPLVSLFCIASAVAFVVLALTRFVRPAQSSSQKKAVKQFVDKLQAIAETIGTPKIILLFRVLRSIAAPTKDTYLESLVEHKNLIRDFRELQRLFDPGIMIE